MIEHPTLDKALEILTDIGELEQPLSGEVRLSDTELDSLDLVEFMFQTGIDSEKVLADDAILEHLETMTIAELYRRLTAEAVTSAE